MAFTDYDDLCKTIAKWLARDDLAADIKDFVWLAEVDLQRSIKFRMQDEIASGETTTTEEYIELPADYAEGGFLRWTNDDTLPSIEVASYDVVDGIQKTPSRDQTRGQPRVGFLHGSRLYIGRIPGSIEYDIFYKAGVQHLSSKVRTNLLLQQYPDCLLYGALVTSAPFLGADERIQTWMSFYENAKEETRMQEWRARSGHGTLRMRPEVAVR